MLIESPRRRRRKIDESGYGCDDGNPGKRAADKTGRDGEEDAAGQRRRIVSDDTTGSTIADRQVAYNVDVDGGSLNFGGSKLFLA